MKTATPETHAPTKRTLTLISHLAPLEQEAYLRIPASIDSVANETFDATDTEARLFGLLAPKVEVPLWTVSVEETDFDTTRTRKVKLTGAEEIELFLRYNYARYRLGKLIVAQEKRKSLPRARQMLIWHERVLEGRSQLASANLALVVAMAKRTRIPHVDFPELVSEGNMALLRSIEKFDVARGFKFSTYGCRAILKSFNRLATKTGRYRQYFPTEYDPEMERSDYDEMKHEFQRRDSVESLQEILTQNRANLTETEQAVVLKRFAIGHGGKGATLAEVGRLVGLTNERVRQIQNHALGKLRHVLDDQYLVA